MTETEFQIFMANRPCPHQSNVRQGFYVGGVWLSVQGGYGKLSTPNTDGAYFHAWEVGFPSQEIEELAPYQSWFSEGRPAACSVYANVPTSVLLTIIARLGEITERKASPTQEAKL
jgi:hypothetical protein